YAVGSFCTIRWRRQLTSTCVNWGKQVSTEVLNWVRFGKMHCSPRSHEDTKRFPVFAHPMTGNLFVSSCLRGSIELGLFCTFASDRGKSGHFGTFAAGAGMERFRSVSLRTFVDFPSHIRTGKHRFGPAKSRPILAGKCLN